MTDAQVHPIEVLLLDVGGVIVPSAPSECWVTVSRQLNLSPGELTSLFYEWEPWYELSTGRIDGKAYWHALASRLDMDPAVFQQCVKPVWEPSEIDPDVIALVRRIPPHIRVAILSNATLALEETLHRFGVADLFDPIINSARIGLRKPDPRIFTYAIDALGAKPEAILFVDDKSRNTTVAQEMGIPSITFDRPSTLAEALSAYGLLAE